MQQHKFRVGQTLRFTPSTLERFATRGSYTVVRLIPPEDWDNQYRIKSVLDGHERVVKESQLG